MSLPAKINPAPVPRDLPRDKAALRETMAAATKGAPVTICPPCTYARPEWRRWTAPRATGRPGQGAPAPRT